MARKSNVLSLRLDRATHERVATVQDRLANAAIVHRVHQADVLREALALGLAEIERRLDDVQRAGERR